MREGERRSAPPLRRQTNPSGKVSICMGKLWGGTGIPPHAVSLQNQKTILALLLKGPTLCRPFLGGDGSVVQRERTRIANLRLRQMHRYGIIRTTE